MQDNCQSEALLPSPTWKGQTEASWCEPSRSAALPQLPPSPPKTGAKVAAMDAKSRTITQGLLFYPSPSDAAIFPCRPSEFATHMHIIVGFSQQLYGASSAQP